MARIESTGSACCVDGAPEQQYLCTEQQRFLYLIFNLTRSNFESSAICPMDRYDKKSWETFYDVWHSLAVIVPVAFFFVIARVLWRENSEKTSDNFVAQYFFEYSLICVIPMLIVVVYSDYIVYMLIALGIVMLLAIYCVYTLDVSKRWYMFGGQRPFVLSLDRGAINLLTAICILGVDFPIFPHHFRKSRRYGAGLMDTGIGLFVFSMGSVSKPPDNLQHLQRELRSVLYLVLFGFGRTLLINNTSFTQDVHEYGAHWNAFYTLAATKFFGVIFSGIAKVRWKHFAKGIFILLLHEYALEMELSEYVMNPDNPRETLIDANREGIVSIPGFVALYLLSSFFGQSIRSKERALGYKAFIKLLRTLSSSTVLLWLFVCGCIFTTSIARVTCNIGYVAWVMAIALTMTILFMILFHLIMNTIWPPSDFDMFQLEDIVDADIFNSLRVFKNTRDMLPLIVDAINKYGLSFF